MDMRQQIAKLIVKKLYVDMAGDEKDLEQLKIL